MVFLTNGRLLRISRISIQGAVFELNGKGQYAPTPTAVSNLYGMVTGMAEDLQSLVGGTQVRRKVYARFLDAVNFVNGNSWRRSRAGGDHVGALSSAAN